MPSLKIRSYLILYFSITPLILSLILTKTFTNQYYKNHTADLKIYGESVAKYSVFHTTDYLITENFTPLQEFVCDILTRPFVKEMVICDNNGSIIAHPNMEKIGNSINNVQLETYLKLAPDSCSVTFDQVNKMMQIAAPVRVYSSTVGLVILDISLEKILKEIKLIQTRGIIFGIIGLCITLVIGLLAARLITVPFDRMINYTEKIKMGDFGSDIKFQGMYEHKKLISALKTMADRIQNRESELKSFRNYLKNIIDSMPSAIIGVDKKGNITQWNAIAEKETGIHLEEAIGQPLEKIIPVLVDEIPRIEETIKNRQKQVDHKKANIIKGKTCYQDITIYPLIANGVEGAVIRIDDVSERVQMEEMMIQSEKMLSVGGLAAGMAHEINNPLAGMMQNASVLISRLTNKTPKNIQVAEKIGVDFDLVQKFLDQRHIIKMLKLIHDSGIRASDIVSNMLSFARKSESSTKCLDLKKSMDETLELVENDYDMKKNYDFRKIKIIKNYQVDIPEFWGEETKIKQVFMNILKNGAEAMCDENLKRKKNNQPVKQAEFKISITADNEYINIKIRDNGPGISEDSKMRIFEPFYTTKEQGVGTGLGLSISYFIITENHNGQMWVESEKGHGTTFNIRLPAGVQNNCGI